MSSDRKLVKIISILYFLLAIPHAFMGIVMIAANGAINAEGDSVAQGSSLTYGQWSVIFAVAFLATAVFLIFYAITGIKGANNPRKIGTFRAVSVIVVIAGVVDLFIAISNDPGAATSASGFVSYATIGLAVAGFIVSGRIKQATEL